MAASPAPGSPAPGSNRLSGPRRVVSVAPKDSGDQPEVDVFLSPRVLDEQAVAMFRATIESLLRQAESVRGDLESALDHLDAAVRDGADATARLEDRVQLGARMLRAFETQLARAEVAVDQLRKENDNAAEPPTVDTSAIDAALARAERTIEQATEDSAFRMEKLLDHALARIREAAMSQLRITFNMPRETDPLVALAERLHALESRLVALERGSHDRAEQSPAVSIEPIVDRVLDGVRAGLRQEMAGWNRAAESAPANRPVRQPTLSLRTADDEDEAVDPDSVPNRAANWG